ncbi:MAG: BatA domain-containing protein, partial [Methylovirgula sp.]
MFGLPLAFTIPAVLVALAGLPVLYYLLRVTPPRPRRVPFPPLRLILDLRPRDETPAHTPWWLLVLRLAIAAAIILAMAGPVFNPLPGGESRPLLLVMDDGWPAAPSWDLRLAAATQRIE